MADHNITIDVHVNGAENAISDLQDILNKVNTLNGKRTSFTLDTNLRSAQTDIDNTAKKVEHLASALQTASSVFSTLSGVSSGLGSFGNMFASSMQAMSGMFSFDALGTAKRYLTAMATRAITGQISGTIQRYDIMNTFTDYMTLAGVDEATSKASLDAVDQSIRGIPIGLDEAAFRLRKYQMYMGDIDRATKFTIGIQKAITAGGASDQMKTTAYTQIDRLLATGKLGQSRQWLSLFNGLGVSLKFLKEELSLDPTADLKTVAADLASGAISTDAFISAIERLADNEGLDRALDIYKGTIEAWQSNINNAVKRAGQNIMENVNGVMEDTLGYGITGVMKNIRDGIDTMSKVAGDYIQSNPQHVRVLGDAIGGLIDRVMSLDGGRFVTNIVNNISGILGVIGQIFDSLPPGFIEDFVAFATTWAGPLGTVMTAAQSGLGVVIGVFERLQKMDLSDLISKITREIERMADIVFKILDHIPDGLLGDLMAFGLVWGKPVAKVLGMIASALGAVSTAMMNASLGGSGGLLGQLIGWVIANPGAAAALGAVAASVAAIGVSLYKAYEVGRSRQETVSEILGLEELEQSFQDYQRINEEIEQTRKEYDNTVSTIEAKAADAHAIIAEIFDLYGQLDTIESEYEKNKILEKIADDITVLQELAPGIDLSELLTGTVDSSEAEKLRDLADAYIDLAMAEAEAEAARTALQGYANERYTLGLNLEDWRQQRKELDETIKQQFAEAERLKQEAYDEAIRAGNYTTEGGVVKPFYDLSDPNSTYNKYLTAHEAARQGRSEWFRLGRQIEEGEEEYAELYDDMLGVAADLREYQGEISDRSKRDFDGVTTSADKASQALDTLARSYGELKDAAEESMRSQIDLLKELDKESQPSLDSLNQNIGDNLAYIDEAYGAADSIYGILTDENAPLTDRTRKAFATFISDQLNKGNYKAVEELNTAMQENLLDAITKYAPNILKYAEGGGTIIESAAETDANLQLLADSGGVIETTLAAIDRYNENEAAKKAGEDAGEASVGIMDFANALMDSAGNASRLARDAASASESVDEMGGTALIRSGAVNMLASGVGNLSGQASTAASEVQSLARAIDNLHNKDVSINVSVNMSGSLGFGPVGKSGTSHSSGHSGTGGTWPAWGGLIDYLSDGGFPGFARGTDTIPAWLTPGEFVMRRSAVGLFGTRFMDRINKMDIGGAFDALMMRISNPMNYHGNTYNRDNHATVNNYFMGDNGQSYSQRKAYRFAGSL